MHNRRSRGFRHRSNGRGFRRQGGDHDNKRMITNSFTNIRGKNNFKPYTGALNITNSNISMNIDSSQPILINDNNDGIPTAGEEFGISVPIINFGSQIVQGITATLTSYSSLINILNNQIFNRNY